MVAQLALMAKPIPDSSVLDLSSAEAVYLVPSTFHTLFEAKASMDTLTMSSLRFVRSTSGNKNIPPTTVSPATRKLYLQTQFQQWLRSFEALMEVTETNIQESLLLRIHHKATYIWLSTCLIGNETIFDLYTEDFKSIITCAQQLDPTMSPKSLFTLDMAVIPPLYLTAIKCRVPGIRHQAIALLNAIPGREGLWEAKIHTRVAERVAAIEEATLTETDFLPSESSRILNAQITSDNTVEPPRNYVIFHTKPNGPDGDLVTWEEDIIP